MRLAIIMAALKNHVSNYNIFQNMMILMLHASREINSLLQNKTVQ